MQRLMPQLRRLIARLTARLARPTARLRGWWDRSPLAARAGVLVAGGALIGVLAGVVALATPFASGERGAGSEGPPPVVVRTVTATPTPTPTPTPTATPTPAATETPEPTPTEPPTVRTIAELTAGYGDPPGTDLGRFRIPALGVDAPMGTRVVSEDGVMPNPSGPADVSWYNFDGWDGLGGTPGGGDNAVFSGHVDYAANVPYAGVFFRGHGVFFSLDVLLPGDVIEIDYNGETLRYEVQWRQQVNAANSNWSEILSANVGPDSITLITCGGDFNYTDRSYEDRVVVRAVRI